jgi:indole-3-glycerol phosphate synthase
MFSDRWAMAQNPKTDLLKGLYQASLEQSRRRRENISLSALTQAAERRQPVNPKDFFKSAELSVIAEIKRASPSKGFLAEIQDPLKLARVYESAGASAISVLTEESGFNGRLEDLEVVSNGVNIPTLRKDFISTEEQILEAKAAGASIILLIIMGLEKGLYSELFQFAKSQNLEVLVETHSEAEIEIALTQDVSYLGINTRNLKTFETDINLFGKLADMLPKDVTKIAESAVKGPADAELYRQHGADAVLVGEALVTGDAKSLIESFRSANK